MTSERRLGLLGGTFDPIHVGHLGAADAVGAALGLDPILLVPALDPPHRTARPRTSAFHRFAMMALAVDDRPRYRLSDMELLRHGPSYSADTLRHLHDQGWDRSQLFFILGSDAFAEIATWHEYPLVLDLAHFVVVGRPGMDIGAAIARTPDLRHRIRTLDQQHSVPGKTEIIPIDVRTPDVSSTMIRRRLSERQPIDDMVPAAVARYIDKQQLYGAAGRLHDKDERWKS